MVRVYDRLYNFFFSTLSIWAIYISYDGLAASRTQFLCYAMLCHMLNAEKTSRLNFKQKPLDSRDVVIYAT